MEKFGDGNDVLVARLAALAHPARLDILHHLASVERSCCKDVVGKLDLAQSTVSQHLKVLVEAGLLKLTQDRQRSLYCVDRDALAQLGGAVGNLVDRCCTPPCCGDGEE